MDLFTFVPSAIVVLFALLFGYLARSLPGRSHEEGGAELPRFLCPKCLHFGAGTPACSGCGSPVDPLIASTRGYLSSACSVCKRRLFTAGRPTGGGLLATCRRCGEASDPTIHDGRAVRLVGVLAEDDFHYFCRHAGMGWKVRPTHAVRETRGCLTYVLNLPAQDPGAGPPDPQHARMNLQALWFGPSVENALELGETLDVFLRARHEDEALARLRVMVASPVPASAGANVLNARFPQAEYGVGPAALAASLRPSPKAEVVGDAVQLAVLTEEDLERLSSATDQSGRKILRSAHGGHSPRLGAIRVVCLSRLGEEMTEPALSPLSGISAVWIGGGPPALDELEARIQKLLRHLRVPQSRAEQLLACVEHPDPHPAVRALLESRFGRLEVGVPALEFLARGPEARGWTLSGRAPVRTLGVLNGTDQWVLGEAMQPHQRHDLGGGWLCEATPHRMNYILNLDAPDRTPGSFFATPDPSEIEAIWIHLAAREPLALAEHLDRMDRIPGLRAAEREHVVACVSHADLPSAIRNVLEARFTRISCGVSAEELLAGRLDRMNEAR